VAKKKTSSMREKTSSVRGRGKSATKSVSASSKSRKKPAARPASVKKTSSNGHNRPADRLSASDILDAESLRKIKSPLSAKELRDYRALLIAKRAEILGDMKSMSHEALNGDAANLSHMPIHMADVGSDHYEQELTLGLVESERKLVQEIDEALERIADGSYGVCQATGKPIGKPRLAAKPWAKYCIEAARELERNGGRW